ncbi:hypothetical protein LGH70_03745 [Hymenobacter sp. BT635]|uniref:Uncharacterized protein n=1 Tax=Hymenobacter nitidus TaxID=2880929 RepID=A0ABS8A8E9_9BACT|nr:hypothetical protein [Hymenobacter nitidus]MCB2376676.1 hypothetical protein [Hymenobacter nitidus]
MGPNVADLISLFDEVFLTLGQKPLLHNPDFTLDWELNEFRRFCSVPKRNRVKLAFELSPDGVSFWIDRTSEMPDVGYDFISNNREQFKELLLMIFGSSISVNYKGNRTTLYFIPADNILLATYTFHYGLLPSWFRPKTMRLYDPYFEE